MGRILSVFIMASTGIMPLAMLIFGPVVDFFNINAVFIITGIIMTVLSFFLVLNGNLRNAGILEGQ